jgi:hypothetical protein
LIYDPFLAHFPPIFHHTNLHHTLRLIVTNMFTGVMRGLLLNLAGYTLC